MTITTGPGAVIITAIKGADGLAHSYQTVPFSFDESVAIQLELGRIIGGVAAPVVEFASSLMTISPEGVSFDKGNEAEINEKGTGILGQALVALPEGIIRAGGVDFIKRILANTSREIDVLANDTLVMTPLCEQAGSGSWLDIVYTGGNFNELYQAILWVLVVNFSPFGRVPSWSWSVASSELLSVISGLSKLSIGTSPLSNDSETGSSPPGS